MPQEARLKAAQGLAPKGAPSPAWDNCTETKTASPTRSKVLEGLKEAGKQLGSNGRLPGLVACEKGCVPISRGLLQDGRWPLPPSKAGCRWDSGVKR